MIKTIDARNIPCPGPVIEAKKALKEMDGGSLEVLVDNNMAVQNLQKLSTYLKLKSSWETSGDDSFKVIFLVDGEGENRETERDEAVQTTVMSGGKGTKRLVVLSANYMGRGDDSLGEALMKGFIYALTELQQLPTTILLYNGGAKLSVEGSDSLEDLKLLEKQGVEVLTCGTCLNHYGLSDKLAVGTVTNMYVIAEKMMEADVMIKP